MAKRHWWAQRRVRERERERERDRQRERERADLVMRGVKPAMSGKVFVVLDGSVFSTPQHTES